MNLLSQIKIHVTAGSSVGDGCAGSTFVDMQGYEGCLFLLVPCSSGMASTGTLIIQQCTGTSSGGSNILKSTFTDKFKMHAGHPYYPMAVDVYKPLRRYVRLRTLTCTGMMVVPITYGARRMGSTEALVYIHSSNRPSAVHICSS